MANGFFPAPGTDYTRGQEPEIARRLGQLARALKTRLVGISGYRTPAHSVAVGGFANDPHTRGQASDTGGAESIPESTLERFGLTRPFAGAREANHIQLFGASTRGRTLAQSGNSGPADWLKQAGWPSNLIPIMVAIGGAESGWKVDAVGGPNSNGTYDYGWLQINSSHNYDRARLLTDPVYTARAAYSIYKSQGLPAWSTYTNGAYKSHMGQKPSTSGATFGRTRPGGEAPGDGGGDTAFAAYYGNSADDGQGGTAENVGFFGDVWGALNKPLLPDKVNPLQQWNAARNVIKDTESFFQWVGWLLNPRHILQVVEFITGATVMVLGVHTMMQVYQQRNDAVKEPTIKRVTRDVVAATPPGRAVRSAQAVRQGRRMARTEARREQSAKGRAKGAAQERRRQRDKRNPGRRDIPF